MPNPICNTNCARLDSTISVSFTHVVCLFWHQIGPDETISVELNSWGFLDWGIPKSFFFFDFPLQILHFGVPPFLEPLGSEAVSAAKEQGYFEPICTQRHLSVRHYTFDVFKQLSSVTVGV